MLHHPRIPILWLAAINSLFAVGHALYKSPGRQPLILTPYVESGRIREGQEKSRVDGMMVKSHSGYFTVNKTYDRNLFFWYFPAEEEPKTSPVIIWLQGGPGGSSMFGLLMEHGPFQLADNSNLTMRPHRWTKNNHVIYLDSPAGTGFSFPQPSGPFGEQEIGSDIHNFLQQFFQLFPSLIGNDFYVAGESYAGYMVPSACYAIHRGNPTAQVKVNLAGLMIGNGVVKFPWGPGPDYCKQLGFPIGDCEYYNYLTLNDPQSPQFVEFFNKGHVQQRIHVGEVTFQDLNYDVAEWVTMDDDNFKLAPIMEELLDHYPVLYYYGQLDAVCPYPTNEEFTSSLEWSGAGEYRQADRVHWHVDGNLAGYVRSGGNLNVALVRNAGHMVPSDQPGWALDLITRFIKRTLPQ